MATKTSLAIAVAVTATLVVTALQLRPQVEVTGQGEPGRVITYLPEGLPVAAPPALTDQQSESAANDTVDGGKRAYQQFTQTGNSLYLELADKVIQPWRDDPAPPLEVWLLRARIAQAEHRFEDATADLTALLTRHPRHATAQLLAADAWRRAGELEQARRHCVALGLMGWQVQATLCGAEIMLTIGTPQRALALVENVRHHITSLPRQQQVWATAVTADALVANGNASAALDLWTSLSEWSSLPLAHKLNLADLLLSQEEYQRVTQLLAGERSAPGVLLRRWGAAVDSPEQRRELEFQLGEQQRLMSRSAQRERHLNDLALTALWVDNDPGRALALALENWQYQRSHEDAMLVLTTAERAGRPWAAEAIRDWQQSLQSRLLAGNVNGDAGNLSGGQQL